MSHQKWVDYKRDGILGSLPVKCEARDKEWAKLVKNNEAKQLFATLGFPVSGDAYTMFCLAWELGWQDGYIRSKENGTT